MRIDDQKHLDFIRRQYEDYIRLRTISFTRIGIGLIFVIIAYLAFSDIYHTNIPASTVLLWRSIPIAIAFIGLVATLSPLKKNARIVRFLYSCGLASLLVMMYGLLFSIEGSFDTKAYEIGLILDIFLVFVIANGGTRFLLPVYLIPLAAFIFFQTVFNYRGDVVNVLMSLTNVIIATAVLLVFAGTVEHLRFSEFRTRKILEEKNEIIENKNREIENELDLARSIQKSLMPSRVPEIPGAKLSMVYHPMEAVGGDYVDFFSLDGGNKLGIFICDVSGHGVPAALIAGMIKALNESCEDTLHPGKLLRYLNTKLTRFLKNHFVTALYAVYDTETRTLSYARGGHMYPLLVRKGSVTELESRGICIGSYTNITFEEAVVTLEGGDTLLFYTDGLVESRNREGIMYADTLFRDLLAETSGGITGNYARRIFNTLKEFAGGERFNDDICVVGLEIV